MITQEHFYTYKGVKYANMKEVCIANNYNKYAFRILRNKGEIVKHINLTGNEKQQETK